MFSLLRLLLSLLPVATSPFLLWNNKRSKIHHRLLFTVDNTLYIKTLNFAFSYCVTKSRDACTHPRQGGKASWGHICVASTKLSITPENSPLHDERCKDSNMKGNSCPSCPTWMRGDQNSSCPWVCIFCVMLLHYFCSSLVCVV